jgi:uncharacterized protein YjbI with pentapeptide repeats
MVCATLEELRCPLRSTKLSCSSTRISREAGSEVRLKGARFHLVDLRGARFGQVVLDGAVMRGADLIDVEIDGEVANLVINGVDVGPLIEAELDRREPERAKMRPTDPDGSAAPGPSSNDGGTRR